MKQLSAVALLASLTLLVQAPHWTALESGVSVRLRGISVASERVIWSSGARGTVLRSADGGTTWTRLPVAGAEQLDFRDVDAVSETMAYALSIGNGDASRIYKTSDAGATWNLQFTNPVPDAFYDAMDFWDAESGIAVSDSVHGVFTILMTDNGGRDWTLVPDDRQPPAQVGEGYFAASGTNVAVHGRDHVWLGTGAASRARVLRSVDRGRSWSVSATPLAAGPTSGIYSIHFRDERHGVVVGGNYAEEAAAVDNVAWTADGGATWTLGRGLSGFRSVVKHIPGTASGWLAIGPSGSDRSSDDGRTWSPVDGPGFDTFDFVPGTQVGFASGAGGRLGRLDLR